MPDIIAKVIYDDHKVDAFYVPIPLCAPPGEFHLLNGFADDDKPITSQLSQVYAKYVRDETTGKEKEGYLYNFTGIALQVEDEKE